MIQSGSYPLEKNNFHGPKQTTLLEANISHVMKKIMDSKVPFTVGDMWSFPRGYWLHCSSLPKKNVFHFIVQNCPPYSAWSFRNNYQSYDVNLSPYYHWTPKIPPCFQVRSNFDDHSSMPWIKPLVLFLLKQTKSINKNKRKPRLRETKTDWKSGGKRGPLRLLLQALLALLALVAPLFQQLRPGTGHPPVASRGNPHGFV